MSGDLAAHAARLDRERYVTHPVLGGLLAELLRTDSHHRVLYLYGPGGIGKSATLRALGRLGVADGYSVRALDGRELGVVPTSLGGRDPDGRPLLLLIDEADALGPGLTTVGRLAAALPDDTRLVLSGRRPPTTRWLPDELEPLAQIVRIPPLPRPEALELLRRYRVDPDRQNGITDWALGSPLALVVAANARTTSRGRSEELVRLLTGYALESLDRELLEVASLTWAVDAELLAAMLPERDPAAALKDLLGHTFVELRDGRALLHPLLARDIAARLEVDDPFRHAVLVLRLASVLRERALAGNPTALSELAGLLRDPALRQELGNMVSERYETDEVRPGDHPAIREQLGDAGVAWAEVEALLHTGFVVRNRIGAPLAVATAAPADAPVPEGPLTAPLVQFARTGGFADRTVVSALRLTLSPALEESRQAGPEALAEVRRLRNTVALRRGGLTNPRYVLLNELGWLPGEQQALERFGFREVPGLRRELGGRVVRSWLLDAGAGGLVGLLYRGVAADQGVQLPTSTSRGEQLLTALDGFADDSILAGLELAPLGHTAPQAAAHARRIVRRTVARLLAGHPELLGLVEARYFGGPVTHDEVISALYLSRATYFRRLSQARQLIAAEP